MTLELKTAKLLGLMAEVNFARFLTYKLEFIGWYFMVCCVLIFYDSKVSILLRNVLVAFDFFFIKVVLASIDL